MELIKTEQALTKQGLEINANEIIQSVQDGNMDAIEVLSKLKSIEGMIEIVKTGIDENAKSDFNLRNEKGVTTFQGVKVSLVNKSGALPYSDDEEYNRLMGLVKERKEILELSSKMDNDIFDHVGVKVDKLVRKVGSEYFKIEIPKL